MRPFSRRIEPISQILLIKCSWHFQFVQSFGFYVIRFHECTGLDLILDWLFVFLLSLIKALLSMLTVEVAILGITLLHCKRLLIMQLPMPSCILLLHDLRQICVVNIRRPLSLLWRLYKHSVSQALEINLQFPMIICSTGLDDLYYNKVCAR